MVFYKFYRTYGICKIQFVVTFLLKLLKIVFYNFYRIQLGKTRLVCLMSNMPESLES